jgi:hypothetical protein
VPIRPIKYRVLVSRLRKEYGVLEYEANRGKGSERVLYHPNINGKKESISVKCHGDGTELHRGSVKAILRRFNIDSDKFFE